ncbi:MAG: YybS family protein [Treponema sp.]|nr:YybS family protein [Treponema sp.]
MKNAISRAGIAVFSAVVSVVCIRTGFFIFLFLLPLALSAFLAELNATSGGSSVKTAWASGILAVALNTLVGIWILLFREGDFLVFQWNTLYYSVMVLVFTWINAPLGKYWMHKEVPFRMTAGAGFCVLIFLPVFYYVMHNDELQFLFGRQLEAFGTISSNSGQTGLTTEELLSSVLYVILRGGIPLSCLVFWWVNRQFALLIGRFMRRTHTVQRETILGFRAPFFLIWILSFSLAAILLGRIGNIELMDITGWNILVLSATLFLVQGGAIMMHFLMRLPPLPRILINVGILFLLFRPGINIAVLGLLVLLGVMENWVPFRVPKE